MIDPSRATFVTRAFRYEEANDPTVKALHPNAREIVFDTHLTPASASALATKMLTELSSLAQAFEVELESYIPLSDFAIAPNRYTLVVPEYATDGRVFRLMAVLENDPLANRCKVMVRG